jgi:hypothetical protein
MQTIFWISPDVDQWRLQREGAYKPEKLFAERSDAIDWACRVAPDYAPCRIKIQDYSGRVVEQLEFAPTAAQAAAE